MSDHKINITDISNNGELCELLKKLGNQDDFLSVKEVDSNSDGYFDLNETTKQWPKYMFRRVENALFSKRLIQTQRADPPLLQITFANAGHTPLQIRSFDDFDPQVQPGQILDLRSMGLGNLDVGRTLLNLAASLQADDPATPPNEGILNIAHYLEIQYFPEHPQILKAFGITNIHHLNPRQAVQLAAYIPIERMQYSTKQIESEFWGTQRVINDETPIEQLFSWDQNADGNGVCRNYANIARGVLDALKILQNPENSELNTTYAIELGWEKNEASPGFVRHHSWNAYVTVTKTAIHTTLLDSTWADDSSLGQDPARIGSHEVKLDYTAERMFTVVSHFAEKGLIDEATLARELFEIFTPAPQSHFQPLTESNVEQYFSNPPLTYLINTQILQALNRIPEQIDFFKPRLAFFLRHTSQALKDHARQLHEAKPLLQSQAFLNSMVIPFLQNLKSLIELSKSLPEDFPERKESLQTCGQLLQDAFDHFGPTYIEQFYDILSMAEILGHTTIADQRLKNIASHPDNFDRYRLMGIVSTLGPDRLGPYKELLDIQPEHDTQALGYRKATTYFKSIYESYDFSKDTQPEIFYEKLNAVLENYPSKDRAYLHRFALNIQAKAETYSFDPHTLKLHSLMSPTDIKQEIRNFIEFNQEWDAFVKNCPGRIEWDKFINIDSKTQLTKALEGTKQYFSSAPLSLIQYKVIVIGNEDNVSDYLNPKIDIQHFISKDFAAIEALLKTHQASEFKGLVDRRAIQKKYAALEKSPLLTGNILFSIPNEELSIAEQFYEPLKQALLFLETTEPLLKSNPIQLRVNKRDKKDPKLPTSFIVKQSGEIILFADIKPNQVAPSLIKAAQFYAQFQKNISEVTQGKIKVNPAYDFQPLTAKTFAQLRRLASFVAPLKNKPDYARAFDEIKMEFSNDPIAIELIKGGPHKDPFRQYELSLKANNANSFTKKLDAFVNLASILEREATQFEKDHGVKVSFRFKPDEYFTFDYMKQALNRAAHFILDNPNQYEGFKVSVTSYYETPNGYEKAPLIYVDLSERTISVKGR